MKRISIRNCSFTFDVCDEWNYYNNGRKSNPIKPKQKNERKSNEMCVGDVNDAVVLQRYSTYVSEDHVIVGNAAVLRCHIPSFVADMVDVDHWLIDDVTITSSSSSSNDEHSHWGIHHYHHLPRLLLLLLLLFFLLLLLQVLQRSTLISSRVWAGNEVMVTACDVIIRIRSARCMVGFFEDSLGILSRVLEALQELFEGLPEFFLNSAGVIGVWQILRGGLKGGGEGGVGGGGWWFYGYHFKSFHRRDSLKVFQVHFQSILKKKT